MANILRFETFLQLVLWQSEISGQISDGNWENAKPFNHWKEWSSCKAEVAEPGEETGRSFQVMRDRYNLTAPEFLEIVGDRMCYRLGIATADPEAVKRLFAMKYTLMPESDADWDDTADYMVKYQAQWKTAGIPRGIKPVELKFLKRVLTAMKPIMRKFVFIREFATVEGRVNE